MNFFHDNTAPKFLQQSQMARLKFKKFFGISTGKIRRV